MAVLTKLDWVFIGITTLSVLFSIIKGFARELISLGALVWGFILACWFYPAVAHPLLRWTRTPEVASVVAFLVILFATMLAGGVIAHFAGKLIAKAGLRWFDRLLGASFGLVRGILACAIVVLVLAVFPPGSQPLNESRLAPYVMQGARVIVSVAPREMRSRFRAGFERVRQVWNERKEG